MQDKGLGTGTGGFLLLLFGECARSRSLLRTTREHTREQERTLAIYSRSVASARCSLTECTSPCLCRVQGFGTWVGTVAGGTIGQRIYNWRKTLLPVFIGVCTFLVRPATAFVAGSPDLLEHTPVVFSLTFRCACRLCPRCYTWSTAT